MHRQRAELVDRRDQADELTQTRAISSITSTVASASAPAPPYSSGTCGAWKSRPAERLRGLLRVARLLVDLRGVRRDLGLAQVADRLADRLVLLGEREQGELVCSWDGFYCSGNHGSDPAPARAPGAGEQRRRRARSHGGTAEASRSWRPAEPSVVATPQLTPYAAR